LNGTAKTVWSFDHFGDPTVACKVHTRLSFAITRGAQAWNPAAPTCSSIFLQSVQTSYFQHLGMAETETNGDWCATLLAPSHFAGDEIQ